MNNIELFTAALKVKEPWFIKDIVFNNDDKTLDKLVELLLLKYAPNLDVRRLKSKIGTDLIDVLGISNS